MLAIKAPEPLMATETTTHQVNHAKCLRSLFVFVLLLLLLLQLLFFICFFPRSDGQGREKPVSNPAPKTVMKNHQKILKKKTKKQKKTNT